RSGARAATLVAARARGPRATATSRSARSSTRSSRDALEDLRELEQAAEVGGLDEAVARDRDRILEIVERRGRDRLEAPAPRAIEYCAQDRLRHRQRAAAGLADRGVQRHLARADHIEHTLEAVLERERDRLGQILLVDELHHRVEAH